MKRKIILILLLVCTGRSLFSQDNGKMTQVSGQLADNSIYTEISIKMPNRESTLVSTAKIEGDGRFTLNFPLPVASLFKLCLADNNQVIMIINPGDKITVKASGKNLADNPVFENSPETNKLLKAGSSIDRFSISLDSIDKYYKANMSNPKIDSILQVLRVNYEKIDKNRKTAIVKYITEQNSSLGGLLYIDRLDIGEDFEVYDQYDKGLFAKYPENPFVKDFHNKVEEERKMSIGSLAPELKLPSPDGNEIALSSLRGKIVLIDFWASWCGPCRRENPHVVETYKKYHDKGFEVFGVSLDKTKENWVKAIHDDGLNWTQVSDLKFWQSDAAKLYGVSSIPCTFLIDKDGKIIGKKLRGESLDQKMVKIFGY